MWLSPMKVLVIGGTRFVGKHLVDSALAKGHSLTLFNRGQSRAAPVSVDPGVLIEEEIMPWED